MGKKISLAVVVMLAVALGFAQQQPQAAPTNATTAPLKRSETVVVTGTFEPVPVSENDRSVTSFDTRQSGLLYNSVIDYLDQDPSIDLRQRGADGIQADLSIWGSSFEQTLILLNGLRLNDAQSGHHNMDIPVPLECIERIEVLHGAGSTFHGSDAMGGAVNFITGPATATELRLRAGAGNFGFNQQRIFASLLKKTWSETLAASRDFSSGFMPDRDFRSTSVSSETRLKSALGNSDILLAASDRPFGADQFYGDFPSWERTKSWFASMSQSFGENTHAAFGYRRHTDEFILFRDQPQIYENNHISQSWQGVLSRNDRIARDAVLSYGAETFWDEIDSNNLGHHARNRGAGYLNLDFHALRRASFSVGGREEVFSGGRTEFSPSVAGSVWVKQRLKLHAAASRAFRLPTYTDLYYSDPANVGNPNLLPESAWSFEGGATWYASDRLFADVTVFNRRDHNVIDYVKAATNQPWQATNIEDLRFVGIATSLNYRLRDSQQLSVAYTGLHGSQGAPAGTVSRYVFQYPSNLGVFSWTGSFHIVSARTRVGITQRFGQTAYPVWDLSMAEGKGFFRPYLGFANLSNTGYEEIPGVLMPGRSVVAGLELVFAKKH